MVQINIKTNGYRIGGGLQKTIDEWMAYLEQVLPVVSFDLFYYGDCLVFADCILPDHCAGRYNIRKNSVRLNGYSCSMEQLPILESATLNDELYNGKLQQVKEM